MREREIEARALLLEFANSRSTILLRRHSHPSSRAQHTYTMVRSIILALALPATNAFVPGTKISPRLERMKIKSEI